VTYETVPERDSLHEQDDLSQSSGSTATTVRAVALRRARRVFWGLADQGISSLTNFALSVVVVASTEPTSFGAFSVVFASYLVALGLARGLVSTPLAIRYSAVPHPEWKSGAAAAGGAALVVGVCATAACALAWGFFDGTLARCIAVLAVGFPGLLLQDTWRYGFFAERRGSRAFANDGLWAILMFPALAVGASAGSLSVEWMIAIWSGSATLAALFGCGQAGLLPQPKLAFQWFRQHGDLGVRYAAESLATTGAAQITFFAIGAVAGLYGLAEVRGTLVLLGPLNILLLGVMVMGVPEAVRLIQRSPDRVFEYASMLATALGAISLILGGVWLLLPDSIGTSLLGTLWNSSHALLVPLTLAMALAGVQTSAMVFLYGLGAAGQSLRAALMYSPAIFVAATAGAALWGSSGAAWGFAMGQASAAVLLWITLYRVGQPSRSGS
jgi:hypothetical protein